MVEQRSPKPRAEGSSPSAPAMSEQAVQSLLRFFSSKKSEHPHAAKGYISCRLPGCKRSRDGFGTLPTSCGLRRFEFLRENSKQPFSSSFQKNPEGFTFGILVICFSDVRTASSAGESKKAFASSIERSEKRTTTLRLSKSCRWNSNRLFTGCRACDARDRLFSAS